MYAAVERAEKMVGLIIFPRFSKLKLDVDSVAGGRNEGPHRGIGGGAAAKDGHRR